MALRPSSLLSRCRELSSRSLNKSPIATIRTAGDALAQSNAAPVPRPPQPIKPTRIVSDPAAQAKLLPRLAKVAAVATAAEVLRKERRDVLDDIIDPVG